MRSISMGVASALVIALGIGFTSSRAHAAADPALLCEKAAGISLVSCVKKVAKEHSKCYLADVQETIKARHLDESFATQLDPSVREKYLELYRAVRDAEV